MANVGGKGLLSSMTQPSGIAPKILKETVEQICTPLAHGFNMSLQEGIVPLKWKEANSIPLFKMVKETSL